MKRILASAAVFALIASAAATAATTTTTTTTVTPEQESAMATYVTKHKVKSVEAPSGFTVTTGAVLPEDVQIEEFPSDVGVTGYGYAVVGGTPVVVGSDRKVVRVLK